MKTKTNARPSHVVPVGGLEAEVLNVVWDLEDARELPITVRDVYEELRTRRPIAYTTILTVFRNLTAKRLLVRDSSVIQYLYQTAQSREELGAKALDAILEEVIAGDVWIIRSWLDELDTENCATCGREYAAEALSGAPPVCYACERRPTCSAP